jgi:hypothetical protein
MGRADNDIDGKASVYAPANFQRRTLTALVWHYNEDIDIRIGSWPTIRIRTEEHDPGWLELARDRFAVAANIRPRYHKISL